MTLLLIFLVILLIIGICLMLFGLSSISTQRRYSNHRRTGWPDQSSPTSIAPTHPGPLYSIMDAPASHTDNVGYSDTSPSSYSADSTVPGIDNSANTGSMDYGGNWDSGSSVDVGGGSDFSGFSGGDDFGGGGAGGDAGGDSGGGSPSE